MATAPASFRVKANRSSSAITWRSLYFSGRDAGGPQGIAVRREVRLLGNSDPPLGRSTAVICSTTASNEQKFPIRQERFNKGKGPDISTSVDPRNQFDDSRCSASLN